MSKKPTEGTIWTTLTKGEGESSPKEEDSLEVNLPVSPQATSTPQPLEPRSSPSILARLTHGPLFSRQRLPPPPPSPTPVRRTQSLQPQAGSSFHLPPVPSDPFRVKREDTTAELPPLFEFQPRVPKGEPRTPTRSFWPTLPPPSPDTPPLLFRPPTPKTPPRAPTPQIPVQMAQPAQPHTGNYPDFTPADHNAPTSAEFQDFVGEGMIYTGRAVFFLDMLGHPRPTAPQPNGMVDPLITVPEILNRAREWDRYMAEHAAAIALARQATQQVIPVPPPAPPPPAVPAAGRLKIPLPTKFNGKTGDPAIAFLSGCLNYFNMAGVTALWDGNYKIRWALALMEDKAQRWAQNQLTRMATEVDAQGRITADELREWNDFETFFRAHFFDHAEQIRLREKWAKAILVAKIGKLLRVGKVWL